MNLKCPWDVVGSRLGKLPHATETIHCNAAIARTHATHASKSARCAFTCRDRRFQNLVRFARCHKNESHRVPSCILLVSYSFISWYQWCVSRNIIICSGLNNCCGKRGAWWCVNAMEGEERSTYHFLAAQCCSKTFPHHNIWKPLLGKTEIVSVKQMLRYVKQFSWNGFHVFFLTICFCRLIHRNMNCACSRSISTSSKVTDPSVDATWLRLQSMQHLDTSGICMQSPSITDFMDENGAFRSNRFPYSWCYRFKTWDVWWLLPKKRAKSDALCGLHALLSECLAGRPRTTSTFTPFITTNSLHHLLRLFLSISQQPSTPWY